VAQFLFANNAASTLAAPISNSATSVTLASGTGALFPNPSGSQEFALTFNDAATGLLTEIVYCTSRSGDTLTIVRAEESTTALSWLAGDLAANLWTAGQAAAMQQSGLLYPSRILTASGAFTMSGADVNGAVGLNRSTSLAASSTTLPTTPGTYFIEDLNQNFYAYPVTVSAPATYTIAGAPSKTLNVNGQCAAFRLYSTANIFSFNPGA